MTYRTTEGHQFVVIATGVGANAALVAFTVDGAPGTAANN
jgi:hypothetical protein